MSMTRVGIAIMRNTHVGTRLGHKRAQGLEMSGAALHVDVHAIEIIVDVRTPRRPSVAEPPGT